jgi:hypothetical protein
VLGVPLDLRLDEARAAVLRLVVEAERECRRLVLALDLLGDRRARREEDVKRHERLERL